ncbi:HD domain-containing protein [Neisseriaceae bacterium TC5R-5]|nr:HD domain-containing protein [Neisseriaceae bacterium TC5R-5]
MDIENLSFGIADMDAFQDFRDVMSDHAPKVENLICQLGHTEQQSEHIAELFRVLHSIKGDASMCQVLFVGPFVHSLEGILARLRQREFEYQDIVGDIILLVLDRLILVLDTLADKGQVQDMQLPFLLQALQEIEQQTPALLLEQCQALVTHMTGIALPPAAKQQSESGSKRSARYADILFFRSLALQFEQRLALFYGRTERNLALALQINQQMASLVDVEQLEVAVYMHDIGMLLLPEALWLKVGRMSDDERSMMAVHPAWAAGLLERMPGWKDAAQMVLQHHEAPNGKGYPAGLTIDQICHGARILALMDAFEAVMLKHVDQGLRRSMLRAVAEVNASEQQFDTYWLEPFNKVIRSRLEARSDVS